MQTLTCVVACHYIPSPQAEVPTPGELVLLMECLDSPVRASDIKTWTDKDPVLSRVRNAVLHGWPMDQSDSDWLIAYYHSLML